MADRQVIISQATEAARMLFEALAVLNEPEPKEITISLPKAYLSKEQLAKMYNMSISSVEKQASLMQEHPERYSRYDFPRAGRITRISAEAFADWMAWGDAIQAGMKVPERNK